MKFAGKAEEIAIKLIELFRSGNVPQALAQVFVKGERHCSKWSFCNQLLVALANEKDARTYNQWADAGFHVKKGQKSYIVILAPLQSRREVANNDGTKETRSFTYGFRGLPVFGASQVEGPDGETFEFNGEQFIRALPLIEVAESWGIKVGAYNGHSRGPLGYYSPDANIIELGVENPSTFAHELVHAAEDRLRMLDMEKYRNDKKEKVAAEIVAELGGAVLLCCLGLEHHADLGGCWEYVQNYAKHTGKDAAEVCHDLINRIGNAVKYILQEKEELSQESIEEELQEIA